MVLGAAALGLSAYGTYLQYEASRDRERAVEGVAREVRETHGQYFEDREEMSREAIEQLMQVAGRQNAQMLAFLQRRTSEERMRAAEDEQAGVMAGADAAGKELAAGLEGAFDYGAGSQEVADLNQGVVAREQTQTDVEQAARGQRGAQRGRSQFDTANAQRLVLDQAPISQEAAADAATRAAGRARLTADYQQRLADLGVEQSQAMNTGNDQMLAGAIASTVGQGLLSYSAYRPQAQPGAAPAQPGPWRSGYVMP